MNIGTPQSLSTFQVQAAWTLGGDNGKGGSREEIYGPQPGARLQVPAYGSKRWLISVLMDTSFCLLFTKFNSFGSSSLTCSLAPCQRSFRFQPPTFLCNHFPFLNFSVHPTLRLISCLDRLLVLSAPHHSPALRSLSNFLPSLFVPLFLPRQSSPIPYSWLLVRSLSPSCHTDSCPRLLRCLTR